MCATCTVVGEQVVDTNNEGFGTAFTEASNSPDGEYIHIFIAVSLANRSRKGSSARQNTQSYRYSSSSPIALTIGELSNQQLRQSDSC
jgi:hypothetical protein